MITAKQETYFRSDPEHPGRITTKTSVEQETASFVDDGTHLAAAPYLRSILHLLPTHLIVGSIKDLWCESSSRCNNPTTQVYFRRSVSYLRTPKMYKQIDKNLEDAVHALESVTILDHGGHYVRVSAPAISLPRP